MVFKSKQQLRSFDLLSMLVLSATVLAISAVIISRELTDIDHTMGLKEAENLASQLLHGGFEGHIPSGREPAAIKGSNVSHNKSLGLFQKVGQIGRDPWGQSFQYKVLRDVAGASSYLVVWSYGPNRERETKDETLNLSVGMVVADLKFAGDDFGYIHPLRDID